MPVCWPTSSSRGRMLSGESMAGKVKQRRARKVYTSELAE